MLPVVKNPTFGDTSCFCCFYFVFAYYRLLQTCSQTLLSQVLSFSFKATFVKATSEFQMFNSVVNVQLLFYLIYWQPLSEQFISSSRKKVFHLDYRVLLFPASLPPTVLPHTMCDLCVWLYSDTIFSFKIFIYLALWHVGSQFPAQGWNLWRVLNTGSPGKSPSLCTFKIHPFHGCIAVNVFVLFLWLNMVYEYGKWLPCSPC